MSRLPRSTWLGLVAVIAAMLIAFIVVMAWLIYRAGHEGKAGRARGIGGFSFGIECGLIGLLPFDLYLNHPTTAIDIPVNATEGGVRSSTARLVLHVLPMGDESEVCPAIVQSVAVDVIAFSGITRLQPEDHPMQPAILTPLPRTFGIPIAERPSTPNNPLYVNGVYDGIRANIPLTPIDRDFGRQLVRTESDIAQRRTAAAGDAAETTEAFSHQIRLDKEIRAATLAHAGHGAPLSGTLGRHRVTPTQSRGVRPVGVASTYGLSCVDYTSFRYGTIVVKALTGNP